MSKAIKAIDVPGQKAKQEKAKAKQAKRERTWASLNDQEKDDVLKEMAIHLGLVSK